MPNITFVDVDPEDQARVEERFPDAVIRQGSPPKDELISLCKDAEIVSGFITTKFPREILEKLSKLKVLCTRSVGTDHVDLDVCKEKGITVCNVPDYGSHVIAEHVFALLLSTLRHIPEADDKVESGEFDYHGLRGITLKGKYIGIVGTGRIGRCVARIAHGFGMKILAIDRCRTLELEQMGVRYVSLEDLLSRSDVITLHLPATDETHHMISTDTFKQMKDGVVLVNTARGELIDSDALLEALKIGKVQYALLDVMEHEKNFEENKELIAHPNAVTTPHIAFYAEESMSNMYEDAFSSIDQWMAGDTPEHEVKLPDIVCDMKGIKT
jgi:D-lactate dehydrogenase